MAMPQRDETIEEIKRLDALLEYAVMHGDEAEAVGRATPSRWSRTRRVCFGGMRCDGEKDGSDPILTRRHFAERLDGTGKM